jgi:predicted deacylase
VRVGLITLQTTQSQQLSELLNSLESVVDLLNFKSFTVYDTLNTAIEEARVALLHTTTEEAGTDVICNECGGDLVAEGESKCLDCLEGVIH